MRVQILQLQTDKQNSGKQIVIAELELRNNQIIVLKDTTRDQLLTENLLEDSIYYLEEKREVTIKEPELFLSLIPKRFSGAYFQAQLNIIFMG